MHYLMEREIGRVSEGHRSAEAAEDVETLRRIAAGDRQALATLYACRGEAILRYLLQLTPDYHLAEEILQDTLVAVWRGAGTFGGRSSVLTWLLGIARRQAHNSLRQRNLPLADPAVLSEMPATDPDPQDALLARVKHDELVGALARLEPYHREVLLLLFVEGLSYAEVAEVLGVPIGTVKSRASHARRALRVAFDTRKGLER